MDYGKFKYDQNKKAAEAKRRATTTELKEVKIRPKTGEHDFQTKLRHAREFLEEHDKVKVTVMFRGREISHPEIARRILARFAEELQDVGAIEQTPRSEGRTMNMVMNPTGKKPATALPNAPRPAPLPRLDDGIQLDDLDTA